MTRDEFFAQLNELLDFAYKRAASYPEFSVRHGVWSRTAAAFEQAKLEIERELDA